MLMAVVGVPVIFPDGRLPGPRWPSFAGVQGGRSALFLGDVFSPTTNEARLAHWQSPLGLPGHYGNIADALSAAGVLLAVAAAAGAVAGLIVRWRRGGPLVRQQLLFLALAACPPALLFVAVILTNGAGVPGWIFGLVLLPLPSRSRSPSSATGSTTCAAPRTARCCGWPCQAPSWASTPS